MESEEPTSNPIKSIKTTPVKEILEPTAPVVTKASVDSALETFKTHGSDAAPATDPEGTLVGKVSKQQIIRGVPGRGHDPQAFPVEPEIEKEGEPYCYEHEPIARAEEVMREAEADEISVVSEEKKLVGKATRDAIEGAKDGTR